MKENASSGVLKSKKYSTKLKKSTTQFAAPVCLGIEWPIQQQENAKNVPKQIVPNVPNNSTNVPCVTLVSISTVTNVRNKELSITVRLHPQPNKEFASLVLLETFT